MILNVPHDKLPFPLANYVHPGPELQLSVQSAKPPIEVWRDRLGHVMVSTFLRCDRINYIFFFGWRINYTLFFCLKNKLYFLSFYWYNKLYFLSFCWYNKLYFLPFCWYKKLYYLSFCWYDKLYFLSFCW